MSSSPNPGTAAGPTVVELFQSQGCSSCPPANAILNGLADRPDLLPLNFGVTYWDRLGWKDSFADPAYTARQWEYSEAGGRGNVATPQFIINGKGVVTGSDDRQLARAITAESGAATTGPVITTEGDRILVGAGRASAPATVWFVLYDPRTHDVKIDRGENGGRVLPHRNVVTGLRMLGTWTGEALSLARPTYEDAEQRGAVFIQRGPGGPIIASHKL
ncbi:MAG: hypothetical protein that often co-occurs with aconitase [uncultured Sphingomonadaceae bacterium]|uniref:DUF1223 domain-containing protein n=1 Tax=uncultured Sphingomonadaceae bacterium TaxID=169976 RepID=A0A6J4U2T0_9SPHN|nr:MAG: hypothetical protein that often co-occurs with aconitase [uncultured Sphingomonadaceae bacterium]